MSCDYPGESGQSGVALLPLDKLVWVQCSRERGFQMWKNHLAKIGVSATGRKSLRVVAVLYYCSNYISRYFIGSKENSIA